MSTGFNTSQPATEQPLSASSRNRFNHLVLNSPRRLGMPIAVYPGLALTGARVRDVVTHAEAQFAAAAALHDRYQSPFLLSAMDLSVEAEAFGCEIQFADHEIPFVIGRHLTSMGQAQALSVPKPGDGRTSIYLETVRRLKKISGGTLVLGGCIGPFSLAARIIGVSEALELTLTEPDFVQCVLEKCARFLSGYLKAFRDAGADGVIMAEPAAGLLSPRGMATFSSANIRQIASAVADPRFALILHNCAAKLPHLSAVLETGLRTFHFGAPMDLAAALAKVSPEVVLCGNLDPVGVFVQMESAGMQRRIHELLKAASSYPNFVLSSGCDIPPTAPLASLDAFHQALSG